MQTSAHIAQVIRAALDWPAERTGAIESALAPAPSLALGDVAFPCFQLAKERRAAPATIARDLAARIAPDHLIRSASAAGPYLNIYLHRAAASTAILGAIAREGAAYGAPDLGQGRTLVLDFSSPNVAKPFHFGHLRSTNIGADLARIFEFAGWRVVRKNYIGDWGTQFGFVLYAWQKWGVERELEARAIDYLVELYIRAYRESETDPGVREQARELFLSLEQGDEAVRRLWKRFRDLSLAGFTKTYSRLGIAFDSYDGESSLNDKVQPVIDRFVRAGVAVRSEGALVVEVADVIGREIAPCMLQKSDGASTYAARDCAEALDRWEHWGFGANVYVVSRQEDHFAQVFAALGKLGAAEGWRVNWPTRCENVSFGFVRGMSTRKGEAVWLEHVLDEAASRARRIRDEKAAQNPRGFPELPEAEVSAISEAVGQAALLYFDVSSRRMTDVTFDWDTVLQFEGNTGPYLQYSHARMCGIFRKATEAGLSPATEPAALARLGTVDEEWVLVRELEAFRAAVVRAHDDREPFEVAQYLHRLASSFNTFYNKHVVIDPADPELSRARLTLVAASRAILARGLELLGIRPLEFM